jgi:hypothetical protein
LTLALAHLTVDVLHCLVVAVSQFSTMLLTVQD